MTDEGAKILVDAVEAAGKEETAMLATLSVEERRRLNGFLRTLVISFEGEAAPLED
jgi:hypothetical protein